MSQTRYYHINLNVAGFLRNTRYPRGYVRVFKDDAGRTLNPEEARDFLLDQLSKGHKCIPCHNECSNPCKRADQGCTGFDYAGGGCPGYVKEEVAAP